MQLLIQQFQHGLAVRVEGIWLIFYSLIFSKKTNTEFGIKLKRVTYYAVLRVATKLLMTFCIIPVDYNVNFKYHQFLFIFKLLQQEQRNINSRIDRQENPIISPMTPPISPNIWTVGIIFLFYGCIHFEIFGR